VGEEVGSLSGASGRVWVGEMVTTTDETGLGGTSVLGGEGRADVGGTLGGLVGGLARELET
jgi:hypothetical protein